MQSFLGIDSVQLLTADLDDALRRWERNLDFDHTRVSGTDVRLAYIPVGDIHLELLEPAKGDNPLFRRLRDSGEGLVSLGLRVARLDQAVAELRSKGLTVGDPMPSHTPGVHSARVAVDSTFGLLVDLIERPDAVAASDGKHPLEHIAIVVPSVADALPLYRDLFGFPIHSLVTLEEFVVSLFFADCGNTELEVLEPLAAESSMYPYVERPPDGLHHLCFRTDDAHRDLAHLKRNRVPLLDEEVQIHEGNPCFFVAPEAHRGVVVELLEGSVPTLSA